MLILELSIQGLIQGAIYALIALGLTLVYGLLRILHVAHAALFTLGAYIGVIITNETGSIVLAIVLSMIIVGVLGYRCVSLGLQAATRQTTVGSSDCIHRNFHCC